MTLRERVLQGGAYMVARQGLGLGLSLAGVLLITRLIGPIDYGLYAGALSIQTFLSMVARMGVDVYLIRREGDVDESVYHQAFCFLLLSGLAVSGVGFLASPLTAYWMEDARFLAPLQVLLLCLPLTVLFLPAMARLERALDYRKVAFTEVMSQLVFFVVALLLALWGFGVWAPVWGYFLMQGWMVVGTCSLAGYRPGIFWSSKLLREMLGYGFSYSSSVWVWQLRLLVNPLVVGRYLGPEGVAYVALSIRLVEALSFAKTVTWRVAIATLAKMQENLPRLRRAMEEGMGLQTLALGPLLAGFAVVAPLVLPPLFGERWEPAMLIYPFVALSYLVNSVFNMHSSVLYVLQRNWPVTVFHLGHIVLFAGSALLLVPITGLIGYGLAEVVALAGYTVIHLYVVGIFGFGYSRARPWLLAFVPPLFFPLLGFPWGTALWVFPLLVTLSGAARAQMLEYWPYVRRRMA